MKIVRRLGLVVIVAVVAAANLCGCQTAPTPAPDERVAWEPGAADVLFMSNRDGNADIFVARAGKDDWTNLTNHPAGDNWPEWSPDGTRVLFQSNRTGNLDLWVMSADGSQPVQLTSDPEPDYLPAWSPDGSKITFTSWRREAGDAKRAPHIYVMNADGSGQRRLVADSLETSAGAAWSPNGKQIVYSRKHVDPGAAGVEAEAADIVIADSDGANERVVLADGAYNGSPVFSPDGATLAFYATRGDTAALVTMNVDGTDRHVVRGEGNNWYPRWSPDGRWLIYTAPAPGANDGGRNLDLFAIPVAGGDPVPLIVSPLREAEGRWRLVRQD